MKEINKEIILNDYIKQSEIFLLRKNYQNTIKINN